jgi:hypothetical protein
MNIIDKLIRDGKMKRYSNISTVSAGDLVANPCPVRLQVEG